MVTGARLEFYWKLLGGEWRFASFVVTLQKYCGLFNPDGGDVRFFAHGLAASFRKLTTLSNEHFAIYLLRDQLGLSDYELFRWGLLIPLSKRAGKQLLKALASPGLALSHLRERTGLFGPSR
jgi:hypothetical protein